MLLQRAIHSFLFSYNLWVQRVIVNVFSSNLVAGSWLVDHPTQLICIWIFICQHTSTKDIAGQSARSWLGVMMEAGKFIFLQRVICDVFSSNFVAGSWLGDDGGGQVL